MVDSVRSLGMTSGVTAPLTTQAGCVRHACGASTSHVLTERAVWIYMMVLNVS